MSPESHDPVINHLVMKKSLLGFVATLGLVMLSAGVASAHVVITPSQVGVATTQTFSISVPNEKDNVSVTGLRLVLPGGLADVMPTVQLGWNIATKADDKGKLTEISWIGGVIPAGQRLDFTFRAQVPGTQGALNWKAYQTFSDGTITSWDQAPVAGRANDDSLTPYSETTIINDLAATPTPVTGATSTGRDSASRALAAVALIVAVAGCFLGLRKK
ncbi:MAG: DUF1775 domain-containing protein [bacterium]